MFGSGRGPSARIKSPMLVTMDKRIVRMGKKTLTTDYKIPKNKKPHADVVPTWDLTLFLWCGAG